MIVFRLKRGEIHLRGSPLDTYLCTQNRSKREMPDFI